MSEAKLYVPTMEEVLVHLNARTCCWESIDPDEILQATAELCEKHRLAAISDQNLDSDTGALWVSEQHGRHVVEPGYLTPDTTVYRNWQLYVPADTVDKPVQPVASLAACERVLSRFIAIAVRPDGWTKAEHERSIRAAIKDAEAVVAAILKKGVAPVFIAHAQHSPEDVAIGLGLTEDSAIDALLAAYPAALGAIIEVTTCTMGSGHASLGDAPLVCRTKR